MNTSGDAAEQIVRMSLEGTEVALKLTGSAAKNIAAMLYAVLKNRDKNKTKGRQRLTAMLKSGKELKVFTVSEDQLKQFATEAKLNGKVWNKSWISHKDVIKGGILELTMGNKPNRNWASADEDIPPSFEMYHP